jgi:hypothetical protein
MLQLSSTVLRYLVDIKDASADRKSLIREISFTRRILSVGNTGVQLTVGRYGVLVDVGCGLGS